MLNIIGALAYDLLYGVIWFLVILLTITMDHNDWLEFIITIVVTGAWVGVSPVVYIKFRNAIFGEN